MESDEFAASIDHDEQLEADFGNNAQWLPLAMSNEAMRPQAEGSNSVTAALTDAELDAYLTDDDPEAASKSALAMSINTATHGVCVTAPLFQSTRTTEAVLDPSKQVANNNDYRRQSRPSNSGDSQSARHAAAVPQVQKTSVSANHSYEDTADEQDYAIEFEEPSEDIIINSGQMFVKHVLRPAAASYAMDKPQESDLSTQISTSKRATTSSAAPAAVLDHGSGPASRRSSASNSVLDASRIAAVAEATTTQQEQSRVCLERHTAVCPVVHVATGYGSGSGTDANVSRAVSTLLQPGLQDLQQLTSSSVRPSREEGPTATAATALPPPWVTAELSRSVETPPASTALVKQNSASGRQPQQQLQQQQRAQQLTSAGSWQQSVAERVHLQHEVMTLPVARWEVRDVCDWVERLGLPQYRKKFMHHCVDGNLLTKLNDELLKTDIGIGPLGHRYMLLEGIQAIQLADLAAAAVGCQPVDCSTAAATAIAAAGAVAVAAVHRASSRHSSGAGGRSHAGGLIEVPSGSGAAAAAVFEDAGQARSRASRPSSAPCRGRGRSPSPQASSPAALGPAAGRISVYEQRAKILFELGRAQAREAAQSSTAAQLGGVARLAAKEVARLKGQLADLDRKNYLQVSSNSGSVDNRGQIPWQHVGAGTRAAHPHPESLAKPWDPPDADLTFSPVISKRSQQIMSEARGEGGGAGFLDRLGNDLRRREMKMKELERRHHGGAAATPADAAAASKAAAADLHLVADFLQQHGWASIPTGSSSSSSSGKIVGDQQELDEQLDEVVQSYRKELNLGDGQAQAILAARGIKKVSALASAVKSCQFMDRYKADLSTRDSRLQDLQDKWFKQQFVSGAPRPGSAIPVTQEQRDLASAMSWFKALGWDPAAEEDDWGDLLTALIKRARAYKAEAQKLYDKAIAAAAAAGTPANCAGHHAATSQRPVIDWQSPPWSADGLHSRLQKMLDARRGGAVDASIAREVGAMRPSAVGKPLQAAGRQQPVVGSTGTAATSVSNSTDNSDPLEHAVQLLAGMRSASLEQLEAASGSTKKLAVYRALRTQSFLEFTAADLAARDAKQRAQWETIEARRRGKQVSKQELDGFYKRLQEDGERRRVELEKAKADKADREAKVLSLLKNSTVASSARSMRARPKSATCSVAR